MNKYLIIYNSLSALVFITSLVFLTDSHIIIRNKYRCCKTKKNKIKTTPEKKTYKNTIVKQFGLPDINLLKYYNNKNSKVDTREELEVRGQELLKALNDYSVKGKIIDIHQGPVVTLYEFEPSAGTKSSRIIGLSDDISRSLSSVSARISIISGKKSLGIELPNTYRMFFSLRELIEAKEYTANDMILPIILGKDIGGKPHIVDLAKMPHLLIAGTTGSGKSVGINAIIVSLLYRYTPDKCKFIFIDPKMLELSVYEDIPHLLSPVVTDPKKAVVALKWVVREMEKRYKLMSNLGVRNILNYNARIEEAISKDEKIIKEIQVGFHPETKEAIYEKTEIPMEPFPFIIVVIDEMADLMLIAGKDIEASIQRLAQMARAAGIHLIAATQRPSVDVVTGVIKANFPNRISFKVISKIDSRTILGEMGAEQLLGMGDMLHMGNSGKIIRVHAPYVDEKEIENIVDELKEQQKPSYTVNITESSIDENDENDECQEGSSQDLYTQAVEIVKKDKKVSTSYIQRRLRIGYNKAANLIEKMEENGIISEPNHSGKRTILINKENE